MQYHLSNIGRGGRVKTINKITTPIIICQETNSYHQADSSQVIIQITHVKSRSHKSPCHQQDTVMRPQLSTSNLRKVLRSTSWEWKLEWTDQLRVGRIKNNIALRWPAVTGNHPIARGSFVFASLLVTEIHTPHSKGSTK